MFRFLVKAFVAMTLVSMGASTLYRLAITPAYGAALPTTTYASCSDLRRDYPTGLAATQAAADRATTSTRRSPRVFADAYVLNMHLDRKHRGVLCIKGRQKEP